jgi:trk system potassium uptake protein
VPWSTDRFLRMLLPEGASTAWRDPSGTVAVLPIEVSEEWVGRPVRELEEAIGARVAFVMRFGTGVLPERSTVVQADDTIYVAALSGTITDVAAAALQAPEES